MILDMFWIILIFFLSGFGIYVAKKTNYINFNLLKIFNSLKSESKLGLFMTLGAKVGVGSIIGTTAAIYVSGPGCLFWMWFFTLLTSSLIYLEVIIGGKYKVKKDDNYISGPYFIIKNGLGKKYLALIAGLTLVIVHSFLFLLVQTNTINNIILLNLNIDKNIILICLLLFLIFTITFNLKELLNIMKYIVPVACILFISVSFYIIFKNMEYLPNIIKSIFSNAFNSKSMIIGIIIGIKRSVFANELLIGSTSSTSLVNSENDEAVALMEVFGSYFISFIISGVTALMVLLFLNNNSLSFTNYNELINETFIYHLGNFGSFILIVVLLLLVISVIISGIYIGLSNLETMIKSKLITYIFKIFVVLFCCMGLYISIDMMWEIIDTALLILLIINGICLYRIMRGKNDRKRLG